MHWFKNGLVKLVQTHNIKHNLSFWLHFQESLHLRFLHFQQKLQALLPVLITCCYGRIEGYHIGESMSQNGNSMLPLLVKIPQQITPAQNKPKKTHKMDFPNEQVKNNMQFVILCKTSLLISCLRICFSTGTDGRIFAFQILRLRILLCEELQKDWPRFFVLRCSSEARKFSTWQKTNVPQESTKNMFKFRFA